MTNIERRGALLDLIGSYAVQHQEVIEELGYDPYRTSCDLKPQGDSRHLEIVLWEAGLEAGLALHSLAALFKVVADSLGDDTNV